MLRSLRHDLKTGRIPIAVALPNAHEHLYVDIIRDSILEAAAKDRWVEAIDGSDLETYDGFHYTHESQIILLDRMYSAFPPNAGLE